MREAIVKKCVRIVGDNIVCRGVRLGHVDVTGTIKVPGECRNYKNMLGLNKDGVMQYGPDDYYIEMYVTKSNVLDIEPGYAYFKQIPDGFGEAKITFFLESEVDLAGKTIWITENKYASVLQETLDMDCCSSWLSRELSEELSEAMNNTWSYNNMNHSIILKEETE